MNDCVSFVTSIPSDRERVDLHLQQPTGVWSTGFGRDLAGRLTNVTSPAGCFAYIKDRLGHWTYFDYDPLRRLSAKTNANGVVSRYGYCDCGPSASHLTNAWGSPVEQVTELTFDNQGNRVIESHADGYSVTNWVNALGQRIVSGDGTGYRWYFYNNQGLLTTVSNVCGVEKAVSFDIHDRPEYVTDANGVTMANACDNLGRLLARGYPDDGVEGFGYMLRPKFSS